MDMSDSDNIKLWCWVLGDKPARVFSVSIKHSADIEYLKKNIQKQKSFEDITASALDLYKVGQVVYITAGMQILTPGSLNSLWINSSAKIVHKALILKSVSHWKILYYWEENPKEEVLSVILPRPTGSEC